MIKAEGHRQQLVCVFWFVCGSARGRLNVGHRQQRGPQVPLSPQPLKGRPSPSESQPRRVPAGSPQPSALSSRSARRPPCVIKSAHKAEPLRLTSQRESAPLPSRASPPPPASESTPPASLRRASGERV